MSDELNEKENSQTNDTEVEKTTTTEDSSAQGDDEGTASAESHEDSEVYKRMKKAEADLKEAKRKLKEYEGQKQDSQTNQPALDPEAIAREVRLLAPLSDEEIAEAKSIAKGKNISLEQALETPLFKAFQKEFKEQIKREKAKLSASKGSGQEPKGGFKPNMTREEHMAEWKKAVGI